MAHQRRRQYLINKRLQIGLFLVWIVLPVILLSASLYYFKFNPIVLACCAIAVILLWWHMLILSHRLAGPIYRLEKDLQDIAKGNFSIRIKFRKKDELKSIAEGINKILDEMEKRVEVK